MYKKQKRVAQRNKRNHISSISRNNRCTNYISNDKCRCVVWRKRNHQTGKRSQRST